MSLLLPLVQRVPEDDVKYKVEEKVWIVLFSYRHIKPRIGIITKDYDGIYEVESEGFKITDSMGRIVDSGPKFILRARDLRKYTEE